MANRYLGMAAIIVAAGALAAPPLTLADEMESSFARGARLYDKWYEVIDADDPSTPHPLYPAEGKYTKAKDNWRCKECHGWDYMGKDGAYASGKHASGIKGIRGFAGKDAAEVVALLKAPEHGYGDKMSDADLNDLANFVGKGQVDMTRYIDRSTKMPIGGNRAKGEQYFNTVCSNCHGKEGKKPSAMTPMGAQMGNPWEVMHKILNGQPGEEMPALRAFDRQVVLDIMAHMATLPKE